MAALPSIALSLNRLCPFLRSFLSTSLGRFISLPRALSFLLPLLLLLSRHFLYHLVFFSGDSLMRGSEYPIAVVTAWFGAIQAEGANSTGSSLASANFAISSGRLSISSNLRMQIQSVQIQGCRGNPSSWYVLIVYNRFSNLPFFLFFDHFHPVGIWNIAQFLL